MSWLDWLRRLLGTPAPTPRPAPVPVPKPPLDSTSAELAVLVGFNRERAEMGLDPLMFHPTLQRAARDHARWMAANEDLDHNAAGRTPADRARTLGWTWPVGENIAWGYDSAAGVVVGWMDSPGHRRNLLGTGWRYVGVGVSIGTGGRPYWCAVFG